MAAQLTQHGSADCLLDGGTTHSSSFLAARCQKETSFCSTTLHYTQSSTLRHVSQLYLRCNKRCSHTVAPAGTCLEVQALDELGRAQRLRQVVLVAQHQQRDTRQAGLPQQLMQLAARALEQRQPDAFAGLLCCPAPSGGVPARLAPRASWCMPSQIFDKGPNELRTPKNSHHGSPLLPATDKGHSM